MYYTLADNKSSSDSLGPVNDVATAEDSISESGTYSYAIKKMWSLWYCNASLIEVKFNSLNFSGKMINHPCNNLMYF